MQDNTSTKTTIRLFPSEESTFDSDTLSEEAKWQYYIASYQMTDHTEGVDSSQLHLPYLKRRVSLPESSVEETYSTVFATLNLEDSEEISISLDNYKLSKQGGFSFYREACGPEKKQENDQLLAKLVKSPGWVRAENEGGLSRRMTAWTRALSEDLSGYEVALASPATELGPAGDVAMSEGII